MSPIQWSYRTPPIKPLWKRLWEGFEPIGEVLVLVIGVVGIFYMAVMVVSL